jgi:hypothetical protein
MMIKEQNMTQSSSTEGSIRSVEAALDRLWQLHRNGKLPASSLVGVLEGTIVSGLFDQGSAQDRAARLVKLLERTATDYEAEAAAEG